MRCGPRLRASDAVAGCADVVLVVCATAQTSRMTASTLHLSRENAAAAGAMATPSLLVRMTHVHIA